MPGPCGRFLVVGAFLPAAWAQTLSVGITVGGVSTNDFAPDATARSERLLIGPTVNIRVGWGLGFEFGALRKNVQLSVAYGSIGFGSVAYTAEATAWQFPFLFQYGRTYGRMIPYVTAGPSVRWFTHGTETGQRCTNLPSLVCTPFTQSAVSEFANRTTAGIVAGAGVEVRAGPLRLSPELRYTRWSRGPFANPVANNNQVEALLRIAAVVAHR